MAVNAALHKTHSWCEFLSLLIALVRDYLGIVAPRRTSFSPTP